MLEFKKGEDIAIIEGENIKLEFSMRIEKMASSYLVEIPSFNILLYTKTRKDINKAVHESIVSYFNYWNNKKNQVRFFDHMLELGFNIKRKFIPKKENLPLKRRKNSAKIIRKKEGFTLQ